MPVEPNGKRYRQTKDETIDITPKSETESKQEEIPVSPNNKSVVSYTVTYERELKHDYTPLYAEIRKKYNRDPTPDEKQKFRRDERKRLAGKPVNHRGPKMTDDERNAKKRERRITRKAKVKAQLERLAELEKEYGITIK